MRGRRRIHHRRPAHPRPPLASAVDGGWLLSRKRDGRNAGLPIELPDAAAKTTRWPRSASPPIGCPLSDEGTRRIIDKVGTGFVPQNLKLEALRDDLLGFYVGWCAFTQLSSNKIARQRVQRLEAIAKRADNLRTLLIGNGVVGGWARKEIAMTFPLNEGAPVRKTAEFRTDHGQPDPAPSFDGFLAGLQRLVEAARHKAARFPDVALYRLPRSPLEFMVGNELPKVFERHFERPAGISRVSDGGPYIRFAVAALRELGITKKNKPYALETIARAFTDVRTGRVRRRKK
jgi:hypothetical protein